MVAALTFDLWDTLVIDDSDESRRAAFGLPSKSAARTQLVLDALRAHGVSELAAVAAEASASAWCQHRWKNEAVTPTLLERLEHIYRHAGVSSRKGLPALHEAFATMEVVQAPEPAPGVHAALDVLSRRHPLGIVSDAVVTPGLQLRRILQDVGLLHYFTVTVFSDEAGHSKPAPEVFHRAAAGLGVPVEGLVHVGDRSDKDIAGAEGVGARGVLYTGCKDRGHDAVLRIAHLNELPALIETLS